jgi:hypothetical protein
MKRIFTISAAFLMTVSAWAQAPEKMSYQAVVRNAGNALVTSQEVGMQLSILQGSVTGTAVYVETQTPITNINALVSIEIGSGTVISGTFNTIDWSAGPYFIMTETDPTGGTTYTITGTSQLMSVPYALHANTAENVTNDLVDDADANPSNELQTISRTGTTVTLTNGGGTFTDSVNTYTAGTGIDITNSVISTTGGATLAIGDDHQGGKIFWLDASGQHGLIAATTDQSTGIQWYNGTAKHTGTTGDGLYAGSMNTAMIIAAQLADNPTVNFAAKVCADYKASDGWNFYGDWYLPSIYELALLYKQKDVVGGFSDVKNYWSSTEFNIGNAREVWFGGGNQDYGNKNKTHSVRAIRAF